MGAEAFAAGTSASAPSTSESPPEETPTSPLATWAFQLHHKWKNPLEPIPQKHLWKRKKNCPRQLRTAGSGGIEI